MVAMQIATDQAIASYLLVRAMKELLPKTIEKIIVDNLPMNRYQEEIVDLCGKIFSKGLAGWTALRCHSIKVTPQEVNDYMKMFSERPEIIPHLMGQILG